MLNLHRINISHRKNTKFPNLKIKLNKIDTRFQSKFYNKMFRGYRENGKFLKILLRIYLGKWQVFKILLLICLGKFTHSFQSFTKCFSYLIARLFGGSYKWRVDCLQMLEMEEVFTLNAYFVHIGNISNIACRKESLKFNLLFISKFRFDRVHGKMLNDTHLMVIKLNYAGDTDQQS